MPEYYIRTPEQDESRGPFNISKLRTLAEAGQITGDTLYQDERTEEWVAIAANEALLAEIFPVSQSLKLRASAASDDKAATDNKAEEDTSIRVEDLLKAAEGDTDETRHLKQRQKSFEKAVELASMTLGVMLLLSALALLVPHHHAIQAAISESAFTRLLNYPILLAGLFDLVIAILLLLAVSEVYPLVRGRSMLGMGFGVYVGWALGDPLLLLAFGLGGAGLFVATLATRLSTMLLAIVMGVGGNGLLAYLAVKGRFAEFFDQVQLNLF